MTSRWSVTVYGRGGSTVGIPPELDRLARQFVADLRAAGLHVSDATSQASLMQDLDPPVAPVPATSDRPHSDLPASAN